MLIYSSTLYWRIVDVITPKIAMPDVTRKLVWIAKKNIFPAFSAEACASMVVKIAPAIPIPSTMPTERAVAKIPAAIPRRVGGADPMIALLFGEMKTPVPEPVRTSEKAIHVYGVSDPNLDSENRPIARIVMPRILGHLTPIRSDNVPLMGATIAIIIG